MIITLIGVGLLVLGIIGLILYTKDIFSCHIDECIGFVGVACSIVGIIMTFVCVISIICENSFVDRNIHDSKLTYESIVKQVECLNTDYEDVSKATVIQNVYEWNKSVYSAKYYSSNPWTSWFWNKKYVESLESIELEE